MKKPKRICQICRKVKRDDCERCKPKPFANISHENQSFYSSTCWRKRRYGYLAKFPLCKMCLDKGRTTAGKYVDHITPIRQGGDKFDYSNLQTLCTSCHASKSSKDGKKSK